MPLCNIFYMPAFPKGASIIVPTFREAANITGLVERVFSATSKAGVEAELIIVDDDSNDGTAELADSLSREHAVRLIVRRNERGLASAVLAGFAEAKFDCLVVLDADMQHPPERIPELLRKLVEEGHDFVIGTRYGAGGAIEGRWPALRRAGSRLATWLARPLAPLSDPMSGFFAIRRECWHRARGLDPLGYKIGLELYVKSGCARPGEVPIRFAARTAGKSKLGPRPVVEYLRHLRKLYRFRFPRGAWAVQGMLLGVLVWGALVCWRHLRG